MAISAIMSSHAARTAPTYRVRPVTEAIRLEQWLSAKAEAEIDHAKPARKLEASNGAFAVGNGATSTAKGNRNIETSAHDIAETRHPNVLLVASIAEANARCVYRYRATMAISAASIIAGIEMLCRPPREGIVFNSSARSSWLPIEASSNRLRETRICRACALCGNRAVTDETRPSASHCNIRNSSQAMRESTLLKVSASQRMTKPSRAVWQAAARRRARSSRHRRRNGKM